LRFHFPGARNDAVEYGGSSPPDLVPLLVGSMLHDLPVKRSGAGPAPVPAFDPSLYPRTYRFTADRQARFRRAGGCLAGLGMAGLAVSGTTAHDFWDFAGPTCMSLAVALLGAFSIAHAHTLAVTLYPDAVEIVRLWTSQRMRREEIRGFRLHRSKNYSVL